MPPPPPESARPRDVITEDALSVSPALIGLPLARPWRRAVAMAIDGLLVTVLVQAPSVLLGLAAAYVLLRVSARRSATAGLAARSGWLTLRFGAALALFAFGITTWNSASGWFRSAMPPGGANFSASYGIEDEPEAKVTVSPLDGMRAAAELIAFRQSEGPAEARQRAEYAIRVLGGKGGVEQADIHEALMGIARSSPEKPWLAAVVDSLVSTRPDSTGAPAENPDSLAQAYAAALAAGDPETAAELRPDLTRALAADTLREMNDELASLGRERSTLRARVEALEEEDDEVGLVAALRRIADDLGLGFGWMGLYFTSTLTLWQGRTAGKRLMGIRVIRLNGKPIGWWAAFERFGGYAAGVATGLLGFLQVLWDRNRQAIQDKISETAVIRDP